MKSIGVCEYPDETLAEYCASLYPHEPKKAESLLDQRLRENFNLSDKELKALSVQEKLYFLSGNEISVSEKQKERTELSKGQIAVVGGIEALSLQYKEAVESFGYKFRYHPHKFTPAELTGIIACDDVCSHPLMHSAKRFVKQKEKANEHVILIITFHHVSKIRVAVEAIDQTVKKLNEQRGR